MEDWLSVSQLSKTLNIPETTARRHLNNFEEYFRWEQIGRGKKYHPGSVDILQRIAVLYDSDRETAEIKNILADEYAFVVEEDKEPTTKPPTYDVTGKLNEFQQKQEEFNKQLIEKLHEQQEYIKELLENHEKEIENAKKLNSPNGKRTEQFEKIMAEHTVKKRLEKEALDLWKQKPEYEKFKKVGWFRKEENTDKRYLFINEYINENFEEYLTEEFGI